MDAAALAGAGAPPQTLPHLLARAARAPDAVHVVVDVVGQVEVDDVRDVWDVEAARCHIGRDQDRGAAGTERAQRLLTLLLRAVTVNGGRRIALRAQEVLKRVGALLGLHEQEREAHLALVLLRGGKG